MATFAELLVKIDTMTRRIRERAPTVIANMATRYYIDRFSKKDWEGEPWAPTKRPNPRGSLMLRSGMLRNSIRPTLVSAAEVRVGAGNSMVPYARIHNEGGTISHPGGTAYVKKGNQFAWAGNAKAEGHDYPRTRPHPIHIPQRRYMGRSAALNKQIVEALEAIAKQPFK